MRKRELNTNERKQNRVKGCEGTGGVVVGTFTVPLSQLNYKYS